MRLPKELCRVEVRLSGGAIVTDVTTWPVDKEQTQPAEYGSIKLAKANGYGPQLILRKELVLTTAQLRRLKKIPHVTASVIRTEGIGMEALLIADFTAWTTKAMSGAVLEYALTLLVSSMRAIQSQADRDRQALLKEMARKMLT